MVGYSNIANIPIIAFWAGYIKMPGYVGNAIIFLV
jgi:hypothetical protein